MTRYTPVVYKVSGESLSRNTAGTFSPIAPERFSFVAEEIRLLVNEGFTPCVIVGGGNIFRGRTAFDIDPVKADRAGMDATKVNAGLLVAELERFGPVVMRTHGDVGGVPWQTDEARSLLHEGVVVVVAGGSGRPGMSSDVPAVSHAEEIGADSVLVAKHGVDAVFTEDPRLVPTAERLSKTTCSEVLRNKLKFMDAKAIEEARRARITLYVFSAARRAGGMNAVVHGKCGTVVLPQ